MKGQHTDRNHRTIGWEVLRKRRTRGPDEGDMGLEGGGSGRGLGHGGKGGHDREKGELHFDVFLK